MRRRSHLVLAASALLRPHASSPLRPPGATVMSTRTRANQQPASNGAAAPAQRANGSVAADVAPVGPSAPAPANPASPPRAPLSAVVTDAVKRWFHDAEREAERGDVKQQALLSQMLTEGYGCSADPEAARAWADKAKRRGYRMRGVYCTI